MRPVPKNEIEVAGRKIGSQHPTFFIADVAANHDGDLERAKDLIHLAAEMGADAAKLAQARLLSVSWQRPAKTMGF